MTDDKVMVVLGALMALIGLIQLVVNVRSKVDSPARMSSNAGPSGFILVGLSQMGRGLHIGPLALWMGASILAFVLVSYGLIVTLRNARSRRNAKVESANELESK